MPALLVWLLLRLWLWLQMLQLAMVAAATMMMMMMMVTIMTCSFRLGIPAPMRNRHAVVQTQRLSVNNRCIENGAIRSDLSFISHRRSAARARNQGLSYGQHGGEMMNGIIKVSLLQQSDGIVVDADDLAHFRC